MTATWVAALLVAAAVLVAPGRGAAAQARRPERGFVQGGGVTTASGASGDPASAGDPRSPEDPPSPEAVSRALVLLALAYRSGLPTWRVLASVAEVSSDADVARDLRQVAAALRWGASEREAWASVDPVWAGAGRAVAIAHQAGIAPGPLLLGAADDLWRGSVERLELAAARVGVRLVAPLGLVLLPAFCLTTVVPLVVALGRGLLVG